MWYPHNIKSNCNNLLQNSFVEWFYEIGSVCPSVLPSILPFFCLSRHFLKLNHYFFLNLSIVLETHVKFCVTEPDFLEKLFLTPKLGKWTKNGPKIVLVINFYWVCSIIKICIICCVCAQIPYLGKLLFLRYGPKCSQPIRLQNFQIIDCFHFGTNSWKLKVDQNIFGW